MPSCHRGCQADSVSRRTAGATNELSAKQISSFRNKWQLDILEGCRQTRQAALTHVSIVHFAN